MTDVSQFPVKKDEEELILVCECDCRTFMIRSSGYFECAACGQLLSDDDNLTGFRQDWTEVEEPEVPIICNVLGTEDLAFRRVLSRADSYEHVAALVVLRRDGLTSVWSDGWEGSAEHEDWYQKRVDGLMELLK